MQALTQERMRVAIEYMQKHGYTIVSDVWIDGRSCCPLTACLVYAWGFPAHSLSGEELYNLAAITWGKKEVQDFITILELCDLGLLRGTEATGPVTTLAVWTYETYLR